MNEAEFANMYIERIVNELTELTKIRLMNETRILYLEKEIAELKEQLSQQEVVSRPVERMRKKANLSEVENSTY